MDKVIRVKSINKLGIICIPSKFLNQYGHRSLNNVMLEDGTLKMVRDDDMEKINDRTREIEE